MAESRKTNFYIPFILLLIGGFLIFLLWSAFQATGLGSRVTDTDYYSKGLKYNTSQVEKRAAEVLGWHLATRLQGHTLEFHLTNSTGGVVDHASGSLYLALPDTAENIHLPLNEISAGLYRVMINATIHGPIQARLEMERNGARLNRQLLLNL